MLTAAWVRRQQQHCTSVNCLTNSVKIVHISFRLNETSCTFKQNYVTLIFLSAIVTQSKNGRFLFIISRLSRSRHNVGNVFATRHKADNYCQQRWPVLREKYGTISEALPGIDTRNWFFRVENQKCKIWILEKIQHISERNLVRILLNNLEYSVIFIAIGKTHMYKHIKTLEYI